MSFHIGQIFYPPYRRNFIFHRVNFLPQSVSWRTRYDYWSASAVTMWLHRIFVSVWAVVFGIRQYREGAQGDWYCHPISDIADLLIYSPRLDSGFALNKCHHLNLHWRLGDSNELLCPSSCWWEKYFQHNNLSSITSFLPLTWPWMANKTFLLGSWQCRGVQTILNEYYKIFESSVLSSYPTWCQAQTFRSDLRIYKSCIIL